MLKFDKMPESWKRKTLSQKEVREMADRSERRFNQARSENGRYQAPSQPASSFNKAPKKVATNKIQPDTLWDIMRKSITAPGHISEVVDSTTGQVISTPEASRGGSMLKGAAQGTAAGFTSTGGTSLDLLRSYDTAGSSYTRRANQEEENAAHYREMLERGTLDDGTPITASMRKQLETLAARAEQRSGIYRQGAEAQHAPIARATQSVYDTADRLAAQSAQNIAEAKEGLGSVGQFAVDVGVAGTQLAGDALLAALTGGSALVPMAVRGFGSGTQQARQEGATLGQQVAYGAGSAALSVATEKIANVAAPLRRTFGSGVLDNAITKATGRLGQSAAGQTVLSALSEGGEEVVEALVQPVLQRITYDKNALQQYQDPDYLADTIYQGLIGGALGGALGAAGSIGRRSAENVQRRATDATGAAQTETAPVSITQQASPTQSITAQNTPVSTPVDTGDGAGTTPGTVDTVTDGRASRGVPASDATIAPGAENVNSDALAQILFGDTRQETGDTQAPPTYDNLGSARRGFTTPGMEGRERTSRLAESMPYNQQQEAATGLSREDYAKLFRYESQTEGRSLNLAEELVYAVRDGQRTFLRDIDETAFHELVQSLDDATAWNAPQMDAARMIQQELQGRSVNLEIPSEEYTDFLRIMREHETATGQGVQANAKWSRRDNQNGQSSELEAWDNLQNSNLSEEEKRSTFQRIVKWDTEIEQATEPQQLKDIILNVAQQRGVLNGLTGRQSRIMTSVANSSLDSLTFDQLKQFAYASTSAMSTDATPANVGQKIKTIQILNMLSNPKTAVKNITGNTSFYGLDALSMKGAALLDMALSKVTGTRSVAYERSNLGQAAKAMQMAIAEITMDVDMGGNQSRYGTSSRRTFKASGNFVDRVMSMLERNQAYLLNATDEFYKGLARSNASRTQALVDQGKIKTADKDYAQNQADALARYRTFQDDSKLSLAIQQVHDVLNMVAGIGDSGRSIRGRTVHAFGAGDIVAPFTRVAGNLASRGLEYSPANAVKGIVEMGKTVAQAVSGQNVDPAAQARAVSDTTRGLTGTAIAYGFMLLAQSGLLSQAGDEDDPDVAALNSSEGITGTQLNISATERALSGGSTEWQSGDTLIDLSSIEPLNLLMNLGTEMAKSEGNPIVSSFNAVPKSFMDATAELPVMQFIGNAATDIIKYGQDPQEVLLQEGANTVASSLIPNILRSTARGLDDRPRNTYSGDTLGEQVVDSVKNSIPGLRETLPGSVNPLGEEKLYQGGTADRLLNALLNPLGVNTYNQSEVSRGMEALRERTGDTSFYPSKSAPSEVSYTDEDGNQHSKALTYEERQDYLRDRGAVALTTLSSMMGSSAYKRANDTTKTELLDLCNDYASQRAKKTILGADSVPAWVNNAETAQNDLGISPAEYLTLYHQYGAEIMSGTAYEKTKQAIASGLTVQQYVDMKNGLDANGNGSISQAEARAYLDQQDYSREQKSDLWHIINKSWKRNPYA